jgi:glycosyltransferase involved in cell wall biosynthesis
MTAPLKQRDFEPLVSLVVPVFNEQEVLGIFLDRTSAVMEAAGLNYEYVFVNDGSSDQTLPALIALSAENSRIRVVDLSRNFGKEAALTAGIDHIRGAGVGAAVRGEVARGFRRRLRCAYAAR